MACSASYFSCFVPGCTNNCKSTPEKLFFNVPTGEVREKWIKAVRSNEMSLKSCRKCCEDHFKVEEDVENWVKYNIMKNSGIGTCPLKLKRGVLPRFFDCQPNRKATHTKPERTAVKKRERQTIIQDLLEASPRSKVSNVPTEETVEKEEINLNALYFEDEVDDFGSIATDHVQEVDVSIEGLSDQFVEQCSFDFPEWQTEDGSIANELTLQDTGCPGGSIANELSLQGTSCHGGSIENKHTLQDTSPHVQKKIHLVISEVKTYEILPKAIRTRKRPRVEESGDIWVTEFSQDSPSNQPPQAAESQKSAEQDYEIKYDMEQARKINMNLMEKYPRNYLGLSMETKPLISILEKHTKIERINIFIALRKIRKHETLEDLGHIFGMDKPTVSRVLNSTVPVLAAYLKDFIFWPTEEIIQSHVPNAFCAQYSQVQCIIDCFEISIQKPSDPVQQALTFSSYKGTNTVKYLIACTPDGLVSFISVGFGGRTSYTELVKECGFIDAVPPGSWVMSDRGFKHIQKLLKRKNSRLVRPPSCPKDGVLTKEEVRESKIIASLRIHVERVIRRIREFSLLTPFAALHHELVSIIDSCVTVACALINFQTSIVK